MRPYGAWELMDALLWIVCVSALVVALAALWRSRSLRHDLTQLKRHQYYADNRLKRIPEELHEAVHPLRLQTATLAAGRPLSPELVLSGRLYMDVSAEETERMLERHEGAVERALLVDVRTPREYVAKHAPGAKSVPFEELEARYKTEISATAEKVFVYCSSGDRSRLACDFLSQRGYTNLYNVRDGLQGWRGRTEGEGEVKFIQFEPRR
ncbi:MAG TPA: rhodanese-like domain-containing protein [Nitrospiraceae bacterium]|nr:rhodanese-like domain-containing protein [Nitrospiraceae bacterium]